MVNLEFYNAFWFLQDHPALRGKYNEGVDLIDVTVMKCCKHGFSLCSDRDEEITVYESDDDYESLLGEGYEEEEFGGLKSISLLYSERYGSPWELAKVSFWLELGYSRYYKHKGNYESSSAHDTRLDVCGDTYEEAIVKLAGLVKELYGNWCCTPGNGNCIIPDWVIENNRVEEYFVKDEETNNLVSAEHKLFFNRNEKHISLYSVELSELWWLQYDGEFMEGEPLSIDHLINKDLDVCRDENRFGGDTVDIL
jgi:hypothetical protein